MKSLTGTHRVTADVRHGVIDLTDELRRAIKDSGVTTGCAVAFCSHTTAALLINEWENGVHDDLRARLDSLVPDGVYYAHDDMERRTQNMEDDHERPNGRAHVTQMLIGGTSHSIPVAHGEPLLGRWQRLILLELDDPKEREIVFHVFGD
ncbi:MAG: secondary thiamine-phosphate synthase enzyme YjbQ [Actinomycetota bacterium]